MPRRIGDLDGWRERESEGQEPEKEKPIAAFTELINSLEKNRDSVEMRALEKKNTQVFKRKAIEKPLCELGPIIAEMGERLVPALEFMLGTEKRLADSMSPTDRTLYDNLKIAIDKAEDSAWAAFKDEYDTHMSETDGGPRLVTAEQTEKTKAENAKVYSLYDELSRLLQSYQEKLAPSDSSNVRSKTSRSKFAFVAAAQEAKAFSENTRGLSMAGLLEMDTGVHRTIDAEGLRQIKDARTVILTTHGDLQGWGEREFTPAGKEMLEYRKPENGENGVLVVSPDRIPEETGDLTLLTSNGWQPNDAVAKTVVDAFVGGEVASVLFTVCKGESAAYLVARTAPADSKLEVTAGHVDYIQVVHASMFIDALAIAATQTENPGLQLLLASATLKKYGNKELDKLKAKRTLNADEKTKKSSLELLLTNQTDAAGNITRYGFLPGLYFNFVGAKEQAKKK